jgi:hypothetical protein
MKCVDGELVEWSRHGRTESGRKSCLALLSPPHIPYGLAWDWTRTCAVRGRRLNAVIICDPRSFCVGMYLSRYVSISENSGVWKGWGVRVWGTSFVSLTAISMALKRSLGLPTAGHLWGGGCARAFHCMDVIMHVHRFSFRNDLTCWYHTVLVPSSLCVCVQLYIILVCVCVRPANLTFWCRVHHMKFISWFGAAISSLLQCNSYS